MNCHPSPKAEDLLLFLSLLVLSCLPQNFVILSAAKNPRICFCCCLFLPLPVLLFVIPQGSAFAFAVACSSPTQQQTPGARLIGRQLGSAHPSPPSLPFSAPSAHLRALRVRRPLPASQIPNVH